MNSIEISGQTNSVSESNAFGFKEKDSSPASGPGFGQVFSSVAAQDASGAGTADSEMPKAVGQDLAETLTDPADAGQQPVSLPGAALTPDPTAASLIGASAVQGIWLNGQNPLKAVTLGPGMNAITPSTVEPDMASLADFARAQGLDEHAVRWLFQGAQGALQVKTDANLSGATGTTGSASQGSGSPTPPAVDPLTNPLDNPLTLLAANPLTHPVHQLTTPAVTNAATLAGTLLVPEAAAGAMSTAGNAALEDPLQQGSTDAKDPATQDSSGPLDAAPAALMLGAVAGLEQAMTRPLALAPTAMEVARTAEPTESLMINLRMVAPPLWMQRASGAPTSGTQDNAKASDDIPSGLDPLPAAPTDAGANVHTVELDLSDILRDLRTPSGPSTAVMLAALSQGRPDADPAQPGGAEASDLKIDGGDLLARPMQASAHPALAAEPLQTRAPAAVANPAARVEQMQQQADKMGQAIGQRMLSEIEKGHWEMKMMLRPATLGHIEVQMTLRAGELDASFHAPQAMTRELLQDGLSRLRETLTQAGMDVANIHVGDNSSQKRGGESTPGQAQAPEQTGTSDKQEQAQETATTRTMTRRSEGWDVMV